MNLVMQFRKVCNHPDLFERQVGRNPLVWKELSIGVNQNPAYVNVPEVRTQAYNPIRLFIPKLVFDECFLPSSNPVQTYTKLVPGSDAAYSQVGIETHLRFFNIFNVVNLHQQFFTDGSCFGILRLLARANRWSVSDIAYLLSADEFMRTVSLVHYHRQRHIRITGQLLSEDVLDSTNQEVPLHLNYQTGKMAYNRNTEMGELDLQIMDFMKQDEGFVMCRETKIISVIDNSIDIVPPLVHRDPIDIKYYSGEL